MADNQGGKHVLCVGAAVLDTLFRVHDMPKGEGKVLPYEMLQIAEGMASSAAYAVHRMGGRANLWGAVGDDETGSRILRDLSESGINTSGMTVATGARSALSTIIIDNRGERLIVPFYDHRLHEKKRSCTPQDIAPFDAVLVDVRWPELALDVLTVARTLGKPAILDGDVAPVEILEKLAPAASHIVFSEPAAARLTGLETVKDMLPVLHARYPETFIAVTAGPAGCWWTEPDDPQWLSAWKAAPPSGSPPLLPRSNAQSSAAVPAHRRAKRRKTQCGTGWSVMANPRCAPPEGIHCPHKTIPFLRCRFPAN